MKIWFWWRRPSGYFDACTKALVCAGHDVSVLYERPRAEAPFAALNASGFSHLAEVRFWYGAPTGNDLQSATVSGAPDVLVVASWGVMAYLRAAKTLGKATLRLVAVDTPWRGTLKHWAGRVTHRRILARAFDAAWISGTPQWHLVRRLGFDSAQILEHLYCCDSDLFSGGQNSGARRDGGFLFAGRLVPEKGVAELGEAFARFRRHSGSNRRLTIIGNGPINVRAEGVDIQSFADPPELRSIMDRSYALVNPAFIDHWGVSSHEAASMGLPLILSRWVGSSSRFLWPGLNGLHAGPDVTELAAALGHLDSMDIRSYAAMSDVSERLGGMLTLESWVANFESGVARLQAAKGTRAP